MCPVCFLTSAYEVGEVGAAGRRESWHRAVGLQGGRRAAGLLSGPVS